MAAFRVLSYNVNGVSSGSERVGEVVRACAADIACIQESPRLFRWRSKCIELARQCGLRRIAGGYPAGLLVLGTPRAQVVHTEARWLSIVPRYLQRGLTLAVLEIDGARVTVANMHLDLDLAGRQRHVREILARLDAVHQKYGAPIVLAGDVNERPSGQVWQVLADRFHDAYTVAPCGGSQTFPAEAPRARIDGIFVGTEFEVHYCGVPDVPGILTASDHRPALAGLSRRDWGQ